MAIMNVTKNVKNQFSNDKNLAMRINFYKKYTTNKYKFADWLFDKYVFKENMLLSVMGTIIGLFGGYRLLSFVLSEIRVDLVWFQTRVLPESYCYAVILTILSALVVDFILYFKLEKINMAEALKSVE